MTTLWLIVWLLSETPEISVFGSWNAWGVALVVCITIDLIDILGENYSE